jgi:hypothetical protein
MFAISCIYRSGNKLVFYLLVILGCFVHRSLAIVVPFAFITFSATNTVKLVKIVILISVLYALIGLLDHANILASLFSALSLSEIYSKADIFPWSVPFFYLSLCFSFVVVLVNLTNLTNAPLYISIFSLWPSIIMLFAVKLGLAISPVQRFSTYFAAAWIPFLIFTLDKFKGGFKFFMVTLLLLAASIYFIETLLDPSSGLAPYSYIPF